MTDQIKKWDGNFGEDYTKRNEMNVQGMNEKYFEFYGVERRAMNKMLPENTGLKILEVGCNIGNQLLQLQEIGFKDLWGIEVQKFAVEEAKARTKGINIINASGFDIPYKDGCFDMVFTSGVLIHISPDDINKILDEIYRLSKKYIWGFEYFSFKYDEVEYRGNKDLLWKGDFAQMFLDRFPDLKLVNKKKYPYKSNDNVDCMYLLKK